MKQYVIKRLDKYLHGKNGVIDFLPDIEGALVYGEGEVDQVLTMLGDIPPPHCFKVRCKGNFSVVEN